MKNLIFALTLSVSGFASASASAFANDMLCYTVTGDGSLNALDSQASGFIIKAVGNEQYSLTLNQWEASTQGAENPIVEMKLGLFTCKFQDGIEDFKGLFTCFQPEDERRLGQNVVRSSFLEIPYFDKASNSVKTAKQFRMNAFLEDRAMQIKGERGNFDRVTIDWSLALCSDEESFAQIVRSIINTR